jgi:hypothetical protein
VVAEQSDTEQKNKRKPTTSQQSGDNAIEKKFRLTLKAGRTSSDSAGRESEAGSESVVKK